MAGSHEKNSPLLSASKNSRKRKAPEDLSQNPNTIKARKRNEALNQDSTQAKILKAKANDQAAITYAKGKLRKQADFLGASLERQNQMLDEVVTAVKSKRKQKKIDAESIAQELGFGGIGGQFAIQDDGNEAWEDIEYESDNDAEFEMLWKQDEKVNSESKALISMSKGDLVSHSSGRNRQSRNEMKQLEFKTWQKKWRRSRKSLFKKIEKVNCGGMEFLRKLKPFLLPGKFFTTGEKAVWRNLCLWASGADQDGWIDLPGPAEWWSQVNPSRAGFWIPSGSVKSYYSAMVLVQAEEQPSDGSFERVVPSGTQLRIMDNSYETRDFIDNFFA